MYPAHRLFVCALALCHAGWASEQRFSIPLYFEPNVGQAAREYSYIARDHGRTILVSAGSTELAGASGSLRIAFEGANAAAQFTPLEPLRTKINYLIDNENGVSGRADATAHKGLCPHRHP